MEIIFDRSIGEVIDIFNSLFVIQNYDYCAGVLDKYGVKFTSELQEACNEIKSQMALEKEVIDFFFNYKGEIYSSFLITRKIWECKSLEEYLKFVGSMSESEIKKELIQTIMSGEYDQRNETDVNEVKRIIDNNENTIDFIKSCGFSGERKWNIFCFVRDPKEYAKKFITLINNYVPIYCSIREKYFKKMEAFDEYLGVNIKSDGINFLRENIKDLISLDDYKKIYVTSSFFNAYSISYNSSGDALILTIGTDFQELVGKISGKGDMEANIQILKNLSDNTRFQILKYLASGERIGIEIAQKVGITTATVSYHMNYLVLSNLVNVERKDHKAYYAFNKDKLRSLIGFINREFKL